MLTLRSLITTVAASCLLLSLSFVLLFSGGIGVTAGAGAGAGLS